MMTDVHDDGWWMMTPMMDDGWYIAMHDDDYGR